MAVVEELAKQIQMLSTEERRRLLDVIQGHEDAAWESLSEEALAETWNYEGDSIYDRWREIYGIGSLS